MLEFQNVTKTFRSEVFSDPVTAIDNLSFTIERGVVVGFLGANGAGKTTSLKVAMDFTRPTSGKIAFKGLGKNKREIFSKIGFLPERPYFYPHLTGREFCFYMGKLIDMNNGMIIKQIKKWAPKLRIDFALDRPINTYSKGMLQRVGFLTTVIHEPELIILDEPLSGVDPIGRKELKDVIVDLNNEGKTVFFSSHIVSDVEEICNSVIFLNDGKLVYQGSVEQVINNNVKPVTRIRYEMDGQISIENTANENKNNRLKTLLESGANIVSVEQEKPSLEKIFYKVGVG